MVLPLCDAIKDRIQQHIQDGRQVSTIMEIEQVSRATVYRIINNVLAFGTHTAPRVAKRGRRFKISAAARVGLKEYIESNPWAYQDEMQHELFDKFGIIVSQATISKTLRTIKISSKNLRRHAAERSQTCPPLLRESETARVE